MSTTNLHGPGHLAEIIRACQTVDPGLPESTIIATAHAAGGPKALIRFARELAATPDLLISGASMASPTAQRMITGLRAQGFLDFQLPRCAGCGRTVRLAHHDGRGGKLCDRCVRAARTPACSACGRRHRSGYRVLGGRPFCPPCFATDPRSHETCSRCGQMATPEARDAAGPICRSCYQAPCVPCAMCARHRPVAARHDGGPVCPSCHDGLRRRPRTCTGCGQRRISPHLSTQGPICPSCAGNTSSAGRCAQCGDDQHRLHGRLCARCMVPGKLRALISDDHGRPHPQLLGVEAYLLRNQDNAEAVLSWIRRSPMSRVIHDMAVGTTPISLRVVAELPATGATGYLAALLMESGVVPAENFERLRLEAWERDFFATFPDLSTRALLHRYAAWVVNPRFPAPAGTGAGDDGRRLQASKTHLHLVAAFLDTLQNQGWELTTVPQRVFDNYVATHGRAGLELTPFIRWARTQHLTRLHSDYLQSHPRGPAISEDQRWAWVAELLHTEELPLPARVSGLLVLLYGATLTRLVSLDREAVTLEDTTTWITLGTDPIQLPDKIGRLLRRLLDTAPEVGEGRTWLFPGARPGRHLTTAALSAPLGRRGINLQAGKTAALITLAREVPPSVLADLLGLSLEATTRWSALAGHDWADYPRTRLADTGSPDETGQRDSSRASN